MAALGHESTGAVSTAEYSISRSAVEILFWGGILVLLGHLFYYVPPSEAFSFRFAPHAQLGRVLLLVGGAFFCGGLRGSRLMPAAVLLTITCMLQAALMAGGWALVSFELFDERLLLPEMLVRGKCLEFGLDFCVLLALLLLLRQAGLSSTAGFWFGTVFWGALAVAAVSMPFFLADSFWRAASRWLQTESAQPSIVAFQAALAVLALLVLVKTRRLLRGHEAPPHWI